MTRSRGRLSSPSSCGGASRSSRHSSEPTSSATVDLSYQVGDGPETDRLLRRVRAASPARARRLSLVSRDSEVLPEPDPDEVTATNDHSARDYEPWRRHRRALRDPRRPRRRRVLEGLPGPRRGRGRRASAQALRQRRRLRRGSSRDRSAPEGPPPERRRGLSGPARPSDGDWYLITEYIDGRIARGVRNRRTPAPRSRSHRRCPRRPRRPRRNPSRIRSPQPS